MTMNRMLKTVTGLTLAVFAAGVSWCAEDELATFAAALSEETAAPVVAADILPMRLDPSFVMPRTALPPAWRDVTAMTNHYPVMGAGNLDVIRSEAKLLAGAVQVDSGTLSFALTTEDGREIWSSGGLEKGTRKTFAVDVRECPLVTFATRGTGTGSWTNLVYTRDKENWERPSRPIDSMHPLATYRLEQVRDNRDWENPFVFQRNREPRHATMTTFDTPEQARTAKGRVDSPHWLSLDGPWRALFTPHPDLAPAGFFKSEFDDAAWRLVDVPNTSEVVGMGTPQFCAFGYWWMVDPPFVTRPPTDRAWTVAREPNGTVNYRRTFDLPAEWKDAPVKLVFDGFGAAIYVWMNGQMVGYAEDGRPGAEFDVTSFVKPGRNVLAVQVLRLCDGCYMEDQDYMRLSGLFRSVGLWRRPKTHMRDFVVKTSRTSDAEPYLGGTWQVDVTSELVNALGGEQVTAELFDSSGTRVARGTSPLMVKAPRLWSAEEPNLYKLVLTLRNTDGRVIEAIPQPVGFREVENRGACILVNGQPVKFNGVNRHELAPEKGYTMTDELIERDFRLLKQNNVNAIRLSHYPNGPRFYELANEWGFYILDEANFESHGLSEHGWNGYQKRKGFHGLGGARNPAVDPRFRAAAMDRETGMVLRDRNQPCVVMWSLGNEIFVTSDFFSEAYDTIKALDATRPVMNQRNGKKDLVDSMYARPQALVAYAQGKDVVRPFIPCEYEHTEGNSYGNLIDYGRAFWDYDCLQGGFLWDYADQELPVKRDPKAVKPGQPDWMWGYGGDFGDRPAHGTGCCNGAVRADRTPSPGVPEFKYIYQDAHVVASDPLAGIFTMTNRTFFTSLAKYELNWTCEDDCRVTVQGTLGRMDIPPQGGATVTLPVPPAVAGTRVRTWNFRWCAAEATRWCTKGFICAQDQVVVSAVSGAPRPAPSTTLDIKSNDGAVVVSNSNQTWTISKKTGAVTDWTVDGRAVLRGALEPCLWRAPVSKERAALNQVKKNWADAAQQRVVKDVVVGPDSVTVDWAFPTAAETTGTVVYRFRKNLEVTFTLRPKGLKPILVSKGWMRPPEPVPPPLARVGMEFRVAKELGRVDWFGRGPHENYPGRTASAFFGRYSLPAAEFLFPYSKPQESGNRSGVYEATLSDAMGRGIRLTAPQAPFHFNILGFTAEELERRAHQAELEACGDWIVHVDGFVRGVDGTGAGLKPDQELRAEGEYSFSFTLEPCHASERP